MKKAVYIALALVFSLSLAACGNSDADRNDNTKDGVLGDGLEGDMKEMGDDIRDAADDITGGGNVGGGTENGSTDENNSSNGHSGTGNGTTGKGSMGNGTTGNGNMGNGTTGSNGTGGMNGAGGTNGSTSRPYSGTLPR